MKRGLLLISALLISLSAIAIDTGVAFEDPEMQARYENIISEVRCLVCQNQTIKDSNVFLASDLRREIRRMMTEGMTDTVDHACIAVWHRWNRSRQGSTRSDANADRR
jgi:cytochrome c-type biogenesis protein CcmH